MGLGGQDARSDPALHVTPHCTATVLQVADKPLANTERYDSLRGHDSAEEIDHA